ncbi:programmed cell death protein 2 [Tricharina praecox]|uniref:programmed cell death protein 2 n=1 Tax=Tricharina praecox TaxID=43433 RepID=UPI0022211A70|nr:programmed cell death protein 2 [Tricharina praecox]KAI5854328.1 programmed cell death protein 2 [Tricharina praecox]
MDDYGSDDESVQDYTETKVLLGYAETEPSSDLISHLGGEPIWPHPSSPADARLAKCACCNKLMPLLLQLNGAIPESPHERMFYVFGCKEKTCRRKKGSMKALRGVKVSKDYELRIAKAKEEEEARRAEEKRKREEDATKPKAGNLLFGSGAGLGMGAEGNPFSAGGNPFSTTATAAATANPFSTKPAAPTTATPTAEKLTKSFADTLRISSTTKPEPEPLLYGPSEPWPSPLPFTYPLFYFDADYETLVPDAPIPQKIEEVLGDDKTSDSLPVSNNDADDGHLDTVFQKFADRAGQNPEQVLRYERGGCPLLYSHNDEVAKTLLDSKKEFTTGRIPSCTECGKRERVFEFQLMPHAISVLEGDSMGLDGMEWGTVIVATCTCAPKVRDVNGVGWVEEWVGVQWEGQN